MAQYPVYRARVYAPRSTDPTEQTVLTPLAGAVHSDKFLIATKPGITDANGTYKAYLKETYRGRRGRLDLVEKKVDTGEWTFSILDKRVTDGGVNSDRWATAFLSGARGDSRVLGLLFVAEESLDNGATFTPFIVGRIKKMSLDGPNVYSVTVRDTSDEMKVDVFTGPPHSSITYASCVVLSPLGGATLAYGPYQGTTYKGLVKLVSGVGDGEGTHTPTVTVWPRTEYSGFHYRVSQSLQELARIKKDTIEGPDPGTNNVRVFCKRVDTGATFQAWLELVTAAGDELGYIQKMQLREVDPLDTGYLDLSTLPGNVQLWYHCISAQPPTKEAPILVNDVHPGQMVKDMLDGKFGTVWKPGDTLPPGKSLGDPRRTFKYNAAAMTAFIADTTMPTMRFAINEKDTLWAWITKNILQPGNIGYRLNGSGEIILINLAPPSSLAGIPTLTDADCYDGPRTWEHSGEDALQHLETKYYVDILIASRFDKVGRYAVAKSDPFTQLLSDEGPIIVEDLSRLELGENTTEIAGIGFRTCAGETYQGQSRLTWLTNMVRGRLNDIRQPFIGGSQISTVAARRTSAVANGLWPGDLCLLQLSQLPDPATNKRGGTRLVRITERSEEGLPLRFTFTDMGLSVVASVPTLGAATAASAHVVTVSVTQDAADDDVTVQYAVTDQSTGTRPAADSPLWTFAAVVRVDIGIAIPALPATSRVWLRARSEPRNKPQVPSAWVFPTGSGYADLAALTAPSSLTYSNLGGTHVTLSWTAGAANHRVEVWYASPAAGTLYRFTTLPANSTRYDIAGLTPSTEYRFSVRVVDDYGGASAFATTTFSTTSAAGDVAPAMRGCFVMMGDVT